jgi:hypothetical protein
MGVLCPVDHSTSVSTSNSHSAPNELEERLRKVFERTGLSIPNPVENYASASHSLDPFCICSRAGAVYIPLLSKYLDMLHTVVDSEKAARKKAEEALAEERTRHARVLQDIEAECREPFVVPALLDAFIAVSQVVDSVSDPEAEK